MATINTVPLHLEGHILHKAASNTDLKMFKLVSNQPPLTLFFHAGLNNTIATSEIRVAIEFSDFFNI